MAIQAQLYPYPSNTRFPLCGSQDLMTDFHSQQNQQQQHVSSVKQQQPPLEQQQQQQQQQQRLQQLCHDRHRKQNMSVTVNPTLLLANSNAFNTANNYNTNHLLSTPISQSLAVEFENQRGEVDHYIRSQSEKLRIMVQEQRKQQVAALLKKAELDALRMLSQKDEQIAEAAKKRAELEEFLRRLEAESLSWRRVAQENEAMVLSLHNTLEQIKERSSYCHNNNNGVEREDAESCCDESWRKMATEEGTGENRVSCVGEGKAQQVARTTTMVCRSCKCRSSCFMFLPCRHLCSCKACEPLLEACPVCRMPKKSSIETLFF